MMNIFKKIKDFFHKQTVNEYFEEMADNNCETCCFRDECEHITGFEGDGVPYCSKFG